MKIPAGFMPGAMAPWSAAQATDAMPVFPTERVKLRRKTGFWIWADVLENAPITDVSEEWFYEKARRPELCAKPDRRLFFARLKDSTEMLEI